MLKCATGEACRFVAANGWYENKRAMGGRSLCSKAMQGAKPTAIRRKGVGNKEMWIAGHLAQRHPGARPGDIPSHQVTMRRGGDQVRTASVRHNSCNLLVPLTCIHSILMERSPTGRVTRAVLLTTLLAPARRGE